MPINRISTNGLTVGRPVYVGKSSTIIGSYRYYDGGSGSIDSCYSIEIDNPVCCLLR